MRFSVRKRKCKPLIVLLSILLCIFLCFIFTIKQLEPAFWNRVEDYAVLSAENAVNNAVTEVLTSNKITYTDLVVLKSNDDGKITALEVDNIRVNVLKAELSKKITKSILNAENGYVTVNLGSAFNSPLFAGLGPKMRIKILPSNQTIIRFRDEFSDSGINQVKHKIYLDVSVKLTLTAAFSQKSTDFKTTIPIADTVIVGTVPSYFGASGMNIIGDNYARDTK